MKRTAGLVLLTAVIVAASSASAATSTGAPAKLPDKLKTPTGNFITLYAFDAPTAKSHVASAQVQVCTSAHTPKGSGVDPDFFMLKLTDGKLLQIVAKPAHQPALALAPLAANQCSVKGWVSFDVPASDHAATLDYSYNGTISWNVS